MPNITSDKKKKKNIAIPAGCIAVGQAKRGTTLELLKKTLNSSKSEDVGKSQDADTGNSETGDMTAEFVFSSEYPVLRYDWWEDEAYYEVLDHAPSSVDTTRIQEGVCPLLWNHNRDEQRGLVLSTSFADGKARCLAKYDDDPEGQSLYKKVMGGTRRAVSFLYQVNGEYEELDMQSSSALLAKYGITDPSLYAPVRVSKNWAIFEISHVSIPADPTVGVGKSFSSVSEESDERPIVIRVKNYTNFPKQKNMKNALNLSQADQAEEVLPVPAVEGQSNNNGTVQEKEAAIFTPAADSPNSESTPVQETITLTADQIRAFVEVKVSESTTPIQERASELEKKNLEIAAENERLRQELESRKAELSNSQKTADVFRDISKLIGRPEAPMINAVTSPHNNHPHGAVKELIELYAAKESKENLVQFNGHGAVQRDPRPVQKVIQDHFREARAKGLTWKDSHLVKDAESFFKSQGLLGGLSARATGPTLGVTPGIGSIYLDVLSSMMRETHNQQNIWWQFPMTVYDASSAPNKSILIPRANTLPAPTNVNDFLIQTYNTYNPLSFSIGTTSDSQSLEITTVPVTVAQWGMGLSTNTGNRPVFIPEFTEQTSLLNLINILNTRLMQHYFAWEDLFIRTQFYQATTVYYNANGNVVTNPLSVTSGFGGQCTNQFLSSVFSTLYAAKWPTMADGMYCLLLPPSSLNALKNDLENLYRVVTVEEREAVSNALLAATGINIGETSGYIGDYQGFHIFAGNSWGVGAAGVDPTVNTTVFGAGSATTEDAFVFAPGAVGRGIALPVEMRASGVVPFQMGESYIWLSREQVAPVDLDASLDPSGSQQTRVAKLRFSRTKL